MSTIESEQQAPDNDLGVRTKGRVKWFNNKAGYGFLTVGEGDDVEDVFVHHSALNTKEEQYKYAVEGEYVEFVMSAADSDNHKWQASAVTGLGGGPLLCETRNARRTRFNDEEEDDQAPRRRAPMHAGNQRTGGRGGPRFNGGPRWVDEEDDNYEWTLVRRRRARGSSHRAPVARHQESVHEEEDLEY